MPLIAQYNSSQPRAGYFVRVDIYLDSQDAATNSSQGHVDVTAIAGGGLFDSTATDWAVAIPGTSLGGAVGGSRAANFSGGSFALLTGAVWTASHNPDGTASISSSFQWNGAPGGWFAAGFTGAQGSVALPTIPRGPKVEFDGAWAQGLVMVEFDGAWAQGLMYAEYDGAWQIVA